MNKLVKVLGFILVLILFIIIYEHVYAINSTNSDLELYPGENYNFTYELDENSTITQPIYCLNISTNETNSTYNYSGNRCEIEHTMTYGETFLREDDNCLLDFTCPQCEQVSCENRTNNIGFRTYTTEDDICITQLYDNETRCYDKSGNFSFETEFEVDCPTFEDYESDWERRLNEWSPINITQDQWYWLCLEPFGQYGQHLNDLTTSTTEFQRKLMTDLATCQESLVMLSENNGMLDEKNQGYEECKLDRDVCLHDLEVCQNNYGETKSSSGSYRIAFWIILILNIIVGMFVGGYKLFMKISGLDGEVH